MKNSFVLASFYFTLPGLHAQQYLPVDTKSSVKFEIKNFGLNVNGSFKGLQGKIFFNPGNLPSSEFNVYRCSNSKYG